MLPLVLSSDSHVFEPPDLWQTRIDRAFRDRAPRILPCRRVAVCRLSGISSAAAAVQKRSYSDWS